MLAVLDAVGRASSRRSSRCSRAAALAALFAASHPEQGAGARDDDAAAADGPRARLRVGADAPRSATRSMAQIIEHWGSDSPQNPWVANAGPTIGERAGDGAAPAPGDDAASRRRGAGDGRRDRRPPRAAEHPVPDARRCAARTTRSSTRATRATSPSTSRTRATSSCPGDGPPWIGDVEEAVDEIQQFLTGARRPVVSDRVLATVLFTDIVGSTERAAQLGDGPWRVAARAPRRARARRGRAPARALRQVARRRRARDVRRAEPRDQRRDRGPRRRARASTSRSAAGFTPASASCSPTMTSAASRSTSARASARSPGPARCSSRAPFATSSSAPGRRSPTAASTTSRACRGLGGCSPCRPEGRHRTARVAAERSRPVETPQSGAAAPSRAAASTVCRGSGAA